MPLVENPHAAADGRPLCSEVLDAGGTFLATATSEEALSKNRVHPQMIVLIAKMMVNHLMLGYFFLGQAHINVLGLAKTERSQSPAVVLGGSH